MDRLEAIDQTWGQVGTAIGMDRLDDALLLAGAAMDISGWDRDSWGVYRQAMALSGVEVRMCRNLPRDWVFYYDTGRWHQLLLVAPRNAEMVVSVLAFGVLMQGLYRRGPGLWPLSPLLAEVLVHALEAPEDAAGAF